jgi:hypothetical protein
MSKKKHRVKAVYTFVVYYDVIGGTQDEAVTKVLKHCGLKLGSGVHTTLPTTEVGWQTSETPNIEKAHIVR